MAGRVASAERARMRGTEATDVVIWALWDRMWMPRLVIRGETGDVLLADTVARMGAPEAIGYEVPRTGHAPALLDPVHIEVVRTFLAD